MPCHTNEITKREIRLQKNRWEKHKANEIRMD